MLLHKLRDMIVRSMLIDTDRGKCIVGAVQTLGGKYLRAEQIKQFGATAAVSSFERSR